MYTYLFDFNVMYDVCRVHYVIYDYTLAAGIHNPQVPDLGAGSHKSSPWGYCSNSGLLLPDAAVCNSAPYLLLPTTGRHWKHLHWGILILPHACISTIL